jgi:DNA uptake protein ComE-like DNA-binding protein
MYRGGMFLLHYPSGHPARVLPGILARRSPDFPPRLRGAAARPTEHMQLYHNKARPILLAAGGALAGLVTALALTQCQTRPPLHVLLVDAPPPTPVPAAAQIAGAVARPGVYPLAPGERLESLIADAGGFTPDADTGRVNLARRVADGERIDVPARGEAAAASPMRTRLNHASRDELLALPGVTVSQAAAIQSSVRKDGPITSSGELVRRRLASDAQASLLDSLVDWSP